MSLLAKAERRKAADANRVCRSLRQWRHDGPAGRLPLAPCLHNQNFRHIREVYGDRRIWDLSLDTRSRLLTSSGFFTLVAEHNTATQLSSDTDCASGDRRRLRCGSVVCCEPLTSPICQRGSPPKTPATGRHLRIRATGIRAGRLHLRSLGIAPVGERSISILSSCKG